MGGVDLDHVERLIFVNRRAAILQNFYMTFKWC
jgi:hypothetical protein